MINTLLQNLAENPVKGANSRRSFLGGSLVTGAAIASAAALGERKSFAQSSQPLTTGDVAILRFLAGAELIEADLWQTSITTAGRKICGVGRSQS